VREGKSWGLLASLRRAGRGSTDSAAARPRIDWGAAGYGQLDWQKTLEHLGPVRARWDLAILSNLDSKTGRRPKDILAAVNAQAETDHSLSPQVLSARLRYLERDGYVRHADSNATPLHRVYYLMPTGTRLINDLLAIVGPVRGQRGEAAVSGLGNNFVRGDHGSTR
jgi:DNA-binding HxlR family transcriptional regulator